MPETTAELTVPEVVLPSLRPKIEGAFQRLPQDKRGAVEVNVTLVGVEGYVGYRIRPGWTAGGWVGREWKTGNLQAGASLRGTF